jgi:phage nucleotide-binding protein
MEIKKLKDVALNKGLKVLLYAAAGTGKTTMASTLPGKTLFLNAENGISVLHDSENSDNIDVVDVKSINDLYEVYDALSSGELKYDNVVLDSVSEMSELMFAEVENDESIEKAYGGLYVEYRKRFNEMIKAFRDLDGFNVLFIALADEIENNGIIKKVPFLSNKKVELQVVAFFDEVLYMYQTSDGSRKIRTVGTDQWLAKSRMRVPDDTNVVNFAELYPHLTKQNKSK